MLLMKTHAQNFKNNFSEVNFECLIQFNFKCLNEFKIS